VAVRAAALCAGTNATVSARLVAGTGNRRRRMLITGKRG
jgi:hypothetical protein